MVCQQLGLGYAQTAIQTHMFNGNQTDQKELLSGVRCLGNEKSLRNGLTISPTQNFAKILTILTIFFFKLEEFWYLLNHDGGFSICTKIFCEMVKPFLVSANMTQLIFVLETGIRKSLLLSASMFKLIWHQTFMP